MHPKWCTFERFFSHFAYDYLLFRDRESCTVAFRHTRVPNRKIFAHVHFLLCDTLKLFKWGLLFLFSRCRFVDIFFVSNLFSCRNRLFCHRHGSIVWNTQRRLQLTTLSFMLRLANSVREIDGFKTVLRKNNRREGNR